MSKFVGAASNLALLGLSAGIAFGQAAKPAVTVPQDKASFVSHKEMKDIWKDLESKKVINKRVMEGGNHSVNVRIVTDTAPSLVHGNSIDVWIVIEGSATAVTGGKLLNPKKNPNAGDDTSGTDIEGGLEHELKAGDVEYVPAGIPHGFKNMKGFHAILVRSDLK